MKVCPRCKLQKPATTEFFYPSKRTKDGLRSGACKVCIRQGAPASRAQRKAEPVGPGMKWCCGCASELPRSAFPKDSLRKDGLFPYCKSCSSARSCAYTKAHPEEHLAGNRRRAPLYREKKNAKQREVRREHPERQKRYFGTYDSRHPGLRQKRNRINLLRWRAENPEKFALETAVANSRRRARVLAAPGHHTAEDIRLLFEQQDGCCFYCDGLLGRGFHVDHRVPLSRGGSDGPENLVVSCRTCNLEKHAMTDREYIALRLERGQHVSRLASPRRALVDAGEPSHFS